MSAGSDSRTAPGGTPRGFVVAGTHSGVGKTSLALGLMGALRRSGHAVAPFKVGPDYIDPMYHSLVSGVPSRNLDAWLMPPAELPRVLAAGLASLSPSGEPLAVVEGVMGLFDGRVGGGEDCSTAHVAKLLGLPVLLVVDCSSMARSVAAIVHGYTTFDPDLRVAGLILNKVAGASHERMIRDALASGPSEAPPVVGVIPRRPDLRLESRHLGLVTAVEDEGTAGVLELIVDHVEANVDLGAIAALAGPVPPEAVSGATGVEPRAAEARTRSNRRVAVARDKAFSFYYQDNLDVLEAEGATLVPFAPVEGDGLPACDSLYLGGGYPEVWARELAANDLLRQDLCAALEDGLPVYAECGGYLYLGEEIEYLGERHAMAGAIPTRATLGGGRLRMGYVEATAADAHPLAHDRFRGHLFHYSSTTGSPEPAYVVLHRDDEFGDGFARKDLVASYLHLHFRGSRAVARWLAGTTHEEEVS